ncbi:hypothetical protein [Erythrobacter crassostreae]|uniref:Uncharacterized protein n=1 Tax=Erythrobacter crassostreae TaxID=2828328 RepID=A0A9X1JNH1_9SPHN|nr:hypothetical protein [Erythrobacter crassostrea]MBV7259703.1 hypothetical protein [Erythrobacter crassostrea]
MNTTRRHAILGGLAAGLGAATQPLAGCASERTSLDPSITKVTVLGAIHGRHRTSELYSLDVLRKAIMRAEPDIVLTELPPDQVDLALSSFAETGKVAAPRARVFPELTEAVFPLSETMGYSITGNAGWSRELADNRNAALKVIENDPARADEWAEHQAARARYSRELRARGDDPRFIHTPEYDAIVERAQTPYQTYFDGDLGPGGWTQINRAHTDLTAQTLDSVTGKGLKALVIFGSWHKYMIERALMKRSDIELLPARSLFD